jgi:PAS domain S-box-containing protein
MQVSEPRAQGAHADPSLDAGTVRHILVVGMLGCLGAAAIFSLPGRPLALPVRAALILACLAMAALFGVAHWKSKLMPPKWVVLGTAWAGCALASLVAVLAGHGIHSPGLAFFALLVCLVAVLARPVHALALAAACATVLGGIIAAEATGWLDGAGRIALTPLSSSALAQALLLAAGLGVGLSIARFARAANREIAERERRFRSLLAIVADGYWELDSQLRFVAADPGAVSILAGPQSDRFGLRPWETHDKMGIALEQQRQVFDKLRAHQPFSGVRIHLQGSDAEMRHLEVGGEPRFAANGDFLGYWGVVRDVTDEMLAGEALRRSQAMLALLFDSSPDCISLSDEATGVIKLVNKSYSRVSGYSVDELLGRTGFDLGLWESVRDREQRVQALDAHGEVSGLRGVMRTKSGQRITMQLAASRCSFEGRQCLVISARDVTLEERTRLEYAAILQRASIGIAFTRDRKFAGANPKFERMIGWQVGTLVGQPGAVVWPSDADYAEVGRSVGPLLEQGQAVEVERQVKRQDGSLFWARLLAQALDPSDPRGGGTIWIAEDVTERRQTEQALALARDAAEAANRAKSAFLANTSHEIRTPLNGLLGMARLATQPGLDEARRQRYLAHILDSAQSLAGIITDILDLSKIEAGRFDLEHADFSLSESLSTVHQGYLSLAEAKGLALSLDMDPHLPRRVTGDALRLRQIVSNFITNALKFTESGQVRIEANCVAGNRVRIAVLDTGPGIEPAVQSRLFQRFSQADESTTRRFGGTGLGLSICRELAHLMGGEVGVHSVPGEGSNFWVELALPVSASDFVPLDSEPGDFDLLRGARVLVAEDNAVNMLIVVAQLEQWGVEVVQAVDGDLAVEAVQRCAARGKPIDAVLMDLQMPIVSGFTAARKLREQYDARRLPIIALTAAALVTERDAAKQSGMCDFLTKPIDARNLRRTLARHLASHAAA